MQAAARALSPREEAERRLVDAIRHRLGPIANGLVDDDQVIDVMLNEDSSLWENRLGVGMKKVGTMAAVDAESFIAAVASVLGTEVNKDKPTLKAELPIRGARLQATIKPVTTSVVFHIRLKAVKIFTLADYVTAGIMTGRQRAVIEDAAATRLNIVIIGGTGGGKTTLANAVLLSQSEATPTHRWVIIEDTRELQCSAPNTVSMRTTDNIDMMMLLRIALRMQPDRIVVGEVRGPEAEVMLQAWNTGHDGGLCTLHANTARRALTRIEGFVAEVKPNVDKRREIAEAVHLIVPIVKKDNGKSREVLPILRVEGFHDNDYVLTELAP